MPAEETDTLAHEVLSSLGVIGAVPTTSARHATPHGASASPSPSGSRPVFRQHERAS